MKLLFLPPYHSVVNPIELQCSQVKRIVRESNYLQTEDSITELLDQALQNTDKHWIDQIKHCEEIRQKKLNIFQELDFPSEFDDNFDAIIGNDTDNGNNSDNDVDSDNEFSGS